MLKAAPSYRSELDSSSLSSIAVVPHLLLFSQTSPTEALQTSAQQQHTITESGKVNQLTGGTHLYSEEILK